MANCRNGFLQERESCGFKTIQPTGRARKIQSDALEDTLQYHQREVPVSKAISAITPVCPYTAQYMLFGEDEQGLCNYKT